MKKIRVKNPSTDIVTEYTVENENEFYYQISTNEWISKTSPNIISQSSDLKFTGSPSNKQLLHD